MPTNMMKYLAAVRNLALKRPTRQSSTYKDKTIANPASSLAVDGNTDGAFIHGSMSHTNVDNPSWWSVDLASAQSKIQDVIIYNRSDRGQGIRLDNSEVQILDSDSNVISSKTIGTA